MTTATISTPAGVELCTDFTDNCQRMLRARGFRSTGVTMNGRGCQYAQRDAHGDVTADPTSSDPVKRHGVLWLRVIDHPFNTPTTTGARD